MTGDEPLSAIAMLGGVKLVAAGALFLLLFSAERLASAAPPPKSKARLVRNLGLWAIVLISSPLIVAPITALGANASLWERPEAMTSGIAGAAMFAADIILLDLWAYGLHRAYHVVPVLSRFHRVHHLDEFLDTTSAFRFHLGEVVFSAAARLIPIALLAVPLTHVIVFETLLLSAAIFHHSNVRLPAKFERALSRIVVTPSIHWVHHHAVTADTNSNYAAIFSFWDRLFSSRSLTKRTPEMKIGLESIEDRPLLRLILMPLTRSGR